jgi:hypothetical protein
VIPEHVLKLFWDADKSGIDIEKHSRYIICRVLGGEARCTAGRMEVSRSIASADDVPDAMISVPTVVPTFPNAARVFCARARAPSP